MLEVYPLPKRAIVVGARQAFQVCVAAQIRVAEMWIMVIRVASIFARVVRISVNVKPYFDEFLRVNTLEN